MAATILTPEQARALVPELATSLDPNVWVYRFTEPAEGWTAFFVELSYPRASGFPFKFTTGVRVTPDRLPFDPPKRSSSR